MGLCGPVTTRTSELWQGFHYSLDVNALRLLLLDSMPQLERLDDKKYDRQELI